MQVAAWRKKKREILLEVLYYTYARPQSSTCTTHGASPSQSVSSLLLLLFLLRTQQKPKSLTTQYTTISSSLPWSTCRANREEENSYTILSFTSFTFSPPSAWRSSEKLRRSALKSRHTLLTIRTKYFVWFFLFFFLYFPVSKFFFLFVFQQMFPFLSPLDLTITLFLFSCCCFLRLLVRVVWARMNQH